MPKMPWAVEICLSACCAPVDGSVPGSLEQNNSTTYKSFLSLGPSAGSYSPPIVGRLRSSSNTGFTICLTEILWMSSLVRKENETLWTVEGIDWAMFIVTELPSMSQLARSA